MADPVKINGNRYYYGSIEIRLKGRVYSGVKSINYGDKKKRVKLYGTGALPLGRTRGKYEPNPLEIEIARDEYRDFIDFLMQGQPATVGIGDIEWDAVVQYAEQGSPTVTDTIEKAAIDELASSNQDNADPSMVKLTCDVARILWNGKPLAGDTNTAGAST